MFSSSEKSFDAVKSKVESVFLCHSIWYVCVLYKSMVIILESRCRV